MSLKKIECVQSMELGLKIPVKIVGSISLEQAKWGSDWALGNRK